MALLAVLATDSTQTSGPGPRFSTTSWTHDVGHVITMAVGTPAVSLWLQELGVARKPARWLTLGTMVSAAVLKEVYDQRVAGSFSGRDLLTNGVGIGIGMVISERMWRVR